MSFPYATWASSWASSWGGSWGQIETPSAQSGVRRLMMYELQEESLKKAEETARVHEAVVEAVTPTKPKRKAVPPAPSAPRRSIKSDAPAAPAPAPAPVPVPFVRRPIYTAPVVNWAALTDLPAAIRVVVKQWQTQLNSVITLARERKKRAIRRRQAAFLLLAM